MRVLFGMNWLEEKMGSCGPGDYRLSGREHKFKTGRRDEVSHWRIVEERGVRGRGSGAVCTLAEDYGKGNNI
ncbi:unnamed protein product [Allacma fusca]|uniref:Uncharacterized protein n=1 Tax=Allacma fusca TaxID=39272 RepID=A0A8J2KDD1_9HEXA|nr:unnamed protein product [Allacma fusca]